MQFGGQFACHVIEVTVIANNSGTGRTELKQLLQEVVYLKMLLKKKNKINIEEFTLVKDREAIINLLQGCFINLSSYEDEENIGNFP